MYSKAKIDGADRIFRPVGRWHWPSAEIDPPSRDLFLDNTPKKCRLDGLRTDSCRFLI